MNQSAATPVSKPIDHSRLALALGVIAVLSFAWLWSISVTAGGNVAASPAAAGAASAALPWLVLHAVCLAVVLSPTMAGVAERKGSLAIAGLAAALVIALSVVAFAMGLVAISGMTVVAAAVGAALGVGVVAFLPRATTTVAPQGVVTPTNRPTVTEMPVAEPPPSKPLTLTGDDNWLNAGTRVGRYTLEARLAVGGMGEVWRAHHDTLIRPAVLKIIRRQVSDSPERDAELMERFRREAQVTANLTSPHTVHLYDFGVEGGVLYIAMELLEAMSIDGMVRRFGPLSESRVAFLLRQACHSLIEAHEMGVVHRDLKPENLLVTRAGRDTDFLKVIDFGLVKELADARHRRPKTGRHARLQQLTALGARPGTPGYMAPEQIGGNVIDQRADIYALACVAYYALTGLPVFEGTEDAQLMFAHMQVEPESPSQRTGRTMHAGLEKVVMGCLAKNPAERPQTMLALDDALAALTFEVPWTQERARSWWTDERAKLRTRARDSVPDESQAEPETK